MYSKSDKLEDRPDPQTLREYYERLIAKYFPHEKLRW